MLKSLLDAVMERRSQQLMVPLRAWLPNEGPVLDLGSGTGHLAAKLERERRVRVVTADVSDIHLVGPTPVMIDDGPLPFDNDTFSAALLVFMLGYPEDPTAVLREAARVTRGPLIIVQTLSTGRLGYARHRVREFCWTLAAFHASKVVGYLPRSARFRMHTRRFYTAQALARDAAAAGLRIRSKLERPLRPGRSLIVTALLLERMLDIPGHHSPPLRGGGIHARAR